MKAVNSNIPNECKGLLNETFEVYTQNNNGVKHQIAQSLNTINGFHAILKIEDGKFSTRSDKSNITDPFEALNVDEYLHAELSFDDQGQTIFDPLHYSPSRYPTNDIDDINVFHFDDGKVMKIWGIVDAGNNMAHVFYQNNQTNNRLVYNLVSTRSMTLNDRIQKQVSKGYKFTEERTYFNLTRHWEFVGIPF
ncbi:MAG: hypothetical protein ACI9JN_000998 [Bacteroidia bacterium]